MAVRFEHSCRRVCLPLAAFANFCETAPHLGSEEISSELKYHQIISLQQEKFPEDVSAMSGMRWLRLNRTGLEMVPYEVSKLTKLVSLVWGCDLTFHILFSCRSLRMSPSEIVGVEPLFLACEKSGACLVMQNTMTQVK